MAAFNLPRGLIAAPVTPLNEDRTLDLEGLAGITERIVKSSHALFLASPFCGEGTELETEQRVALFECVLDRVAGRVPVFMWIGGRSHQEAEETLSALSDTIRKWAYDGSVCWVDCPLLHHSNRGLATYYDGFSRKSDIPFILFNDPRLIHRFGSALKRKNIRTSILGTMAGLERVCALIFNGSMDRLYNYSRVVHRTKEFPIYEGDEGRFLERPSFSGVVSAGANLMAETWGKVTAFCLDISGEKTIYPDHLMQIWKMGRTLKELLDTYRSFPAAVIKAVLARKGLIKTDRTFLTPERDITHLVSRAMEIMAQEENLT